MRSTLPPRLPGLLLACLLMLVPASVTATSMIHRSVVELIDLSEIILVGRVTSVTDGFDRGVPYTEITLSVEETVKGQTGETYTFRQFGLLAPRVLDNGLTYLGVSPEGWPQFREGERVVLFLYESGAVTGLRTTVGLLQGKFTQTRGGLRNGIENMGLFHRVSVERGLLTPAEERMIRGDRGAVPTDTFVSFVRKAVQDRWVETRRIRHVR